MAYNNLNSDVPVTFDVPEKRIPQFISQNQYELVTDAYLADQLPVLTQYQPIQQNIYSDTVNMQNSQLNQIIMPPMIEECQIKSPVVENQMQTGVVVENSSAGDKAVKGTVICCGGFLCITYVFVYIWQVIQCIFMCMFICCN
ncbi:Hypothetical_protein [Hexamita inflata]|uniref:Hypothetical_protein n=1 Tax=Hexamita inflata TaxID=28002 RepID=A0AA86NVK2_9EUKA|nr:Hypothetical protein HINF_LOCUS14314 [Hexamita inflata]